MSTVPGALDHPAFDTLRDVIARCPTPRDNEVGWIDALSREAAARVVHSGGGAVLTFAAAVGSLAATRYEQTIATTGRVPVRTCGDGAWHDYFNALAWLAYPQAKAALNRAQVQAITALEPTDPSRRSGSRGAARDHLTLIDEGAAIVVARDPGCARALVEHDWAGAFVTGRDRWRRSVEVWVVGHALLQKLLTPYKSLCAHAWLVHAGRPDESGATDDAAEVARPHAVAALRARRADVDLRLARAIAGLATDTDRLSLTPLPLLAVPGWCPGNEDPTFYADRSVFRPARVARDRS